MAAVPDRAGPPGRPSSQILILGERSALAETIARRLTATGAHARIADPPTDAEAKAILGSEPWTVVVIVTRDDALALRMTLLCAQLRPELPLWATVFDRTIAHQLRATVPQVRLLSPSELAATLLADACQPPGGRRVE